MHSLPIQDDLTLHATAVAAPLSPFERHESEVRGYCRRFDAVFVKASGSELFDARGRRWIDFLAGCGALNYGHNDADMAGALIGHIHAGGLSTAMDLHTDTKQRFIEGFVAHVLAPRGLPYKLQFTGPSGANAVEAALKLARKVTRRHNVLAFTNGYHGVSLGALAATGNRFNRMNALLPGVTRLPYDGYLGTGFDTAALLETMLDDPSSGVDSPAAVLLELVQGEGGLGMATPAWLSRVADAARRHGALLIVDDVQAGCGRTGGFFSFEGMDLVPDIVVLSKSISGFGLPMALLLIRPELDQWAPAEHNGTFRGNTHAFVTADVAVRKFWSDLSLERSTRRREERIGAALATMAQRVPGARVKGRGLMQGLDVRDSALADRISRRAYELGLVIETAGPRDEVVKLLPPLTTPDELLDEGLHLLDRALRQALAGPAKQAA